MSDANERLIAVTGATGTVGRHVVRQLSHTGVRCVALSRHHSSWLDELPNVSWRPLDFADHSTWSNALEGVQRAFVLSPLAPDMADVMRQFGLTMRRCGVSGAVRLSAMGVGHEHQTTLGEVHGEAEQALRDSVPVVALRPNSFMDNYATFAGAGIREHGSFQFAQGHGAVSFIDARDIADVAVHHLLTGESGDLSVELTGREALTNIDVATKLSAQLGRNIEYTSLEPVSAREMLLGFGMSPWLVTILCELDAMIREDRASHTNTVIQDTLDRQPRTFDDYLRDNEALFA